MAPCKLRAFRLSVISISFLFLIGCGDEKKTAEVTTATADYASLWTNVFATCGGCHGVTSNSETLGGPDLRTKDGAYQALVGVKGSTYSAWDTFVKNRKACSAESFIAAGSAATSLVVAVLDSSLDLGDCVVVNHVDTRKVNVSAANLAVLKQWINAGAKP